MQTRTAFRTERARGPAFGESRTSYCVRGHFGRSLRSNRRPILSNMPSLKASASPDAGVEGTCGETTNVFKQIPQNEPLSLPLISLLTGAFILRLGRNDHVPLNTIWSCLAWSCVSEGQLVIVIRPDVIKRHITMQASTAQSKVPKEEKKYNFTLETRYKLLCTDSLSQTNFNLQAHLISLLTQNLTEHFRVLSALFLYLSISRRRKRRRLLTKRAAALRPINPPINAEVLSYWHLVEFWNT